MRSLDEVINIFEKACDLERRCEDCSGCLAHDEGCPNDGANAVPDALYYLKEYQEKLNILKVRMAEYKRGFEQLGVEWSRIKENPPLTWDELKSMEGKPVWVETKSSKRWGLNDGTYVDAFDNDCITIKVLHDLCHFEKNFIGITWNAYRKERE